MATIPAKIAFDESELTVVGKTPESRFFCEIDEYNYPVSARDATRAALLGEPLWQMIGTAIRTFTPQIIPDHVARGFVREAGAFNAAADGGGEDMFGVRWIYEPTQHGSMEDFSSGFLLEDILEWEEAITFPNIDAWDWEGSAQANNDVYLKPDKFNEVWIFTGWFERLISFIGFEAAAMAMVDEEEQDAARELCEALSDLYINLIDHYVSYFKYIDGFLIHDDWGSAANALFSPDSCEKVIVPAMRRVTDHLHDLGLVANFHSCGNNILQVPNMIKAGWDTWTPQSNVNDIEEIYRLYGDKLVVAVEPEMFDVETTSEDEQRAYARAYAAKYCRKDKPSIFNYHKGYGKLLTRAFHEELYRASRIRYCG